MQTVLIDTDCVIDFLRGKTEKLIPLLENQLAFLSILSIYELYAGMLQHEARATDDFIGACQIEPVSMDVAKQAGHFRSAWRQKGITLSVVDCIIGETARTRHHLLATNNKKHYPENQFWA